LKTKGFYARIMLLCASVYIISLLLLPVLLPLLLTEKTLT